MVRSLSVLALAALLVAPLAAQPQVASVAPPSGTVGTELVIAGGGFGADRPPRAWLEWDGPDGPLQHRLKIVSFSDVELRALVLQAEPGPARLILRVRRSPPLVVEGAFEGLLPVVSDVSPLAGVPGDVITLSGALLGDRRVKVFLFDRPCKVLASGGDSVSFRVPATVPDGEWTPRLENPLGLAIAPKALLVSGSEAPPPVERVEALVGGLPFLAGAADVSAANLGSKLAFDAFAWPEGKQQQLSALLSFAPATGKLPKLLSGSSSGLEPLFFQELLVSNSPAVQTVYTSSPATLPWQAHFLGRSGGLLFGFFEAELLRVSGPGPDTLRIEDGVFVLDY